MGPVHARVVDSTHLELSKPISIPAGRQIKITVVSSEDYELDKAEWRDLSLAGISGAYGDDEPEYPLSMVKEPNAEYKYE